MARSRCLVPLRLHVRLRVLPTTVLCMLGQITRYLHYGAALQQVNNCG
jgi:hypothetical protein